MAKRVAAAQRRGLLYGLIGAVFVAVIFAGTTFWQASDKNTILMTIDQKATDPAQVQQALTKASRALADAGQTVGTKPLTEVITDLANQSKNYETAIKELGFSMTEQSPPGDLHGEALLTWVKDQRNKSDLVLADSAKDLAIVPKEPDVKDVKVEKPTNLVSALGLEGKHIEALAQAYDQKIADLQGAKTNSEQLTKTIAEIKKADEDKLAALADEKQKTIVQLQETQRKVQEQSDKLVTEKEEVRAAMIKAQAQAEAKAKQLTNKINELDAQVAEFAQKMQRSTAREFEADGKIVRLAAGAKTGYINLSRKDGVFNNLTFSVFDQLDLGKANVQPKGSLRITNVMDDASEVEITTLHKSNPIIEGDVIANVVYDHNRRFHFAVVGRFDLTNSGHDDAEAVRKLIERYGGKVDDKVTVHTDYLVVGTDPLSMSTAGVTPQGEVRNKQLQAEMGEATEFARRYWIPVLNQNRFLSLIGIQAADVK